GEAGAPGGIWLGAPAPPPGPAPGVRGPTALPRGMARGGAQAPGDLPGGLARWAGPRGPGGREPPAPRDPPAHSPRRPRSPPGAAAVPASASPAPGTLRLAVDIGSTSTVAVEEDNATAGSIGAKLLPQGAPRSTPSGFRRLAGDPGTAHEVGCAEHLLAPGEQ